MKMKKLKIIALILIALMAIVNTYYYQSSLDINNDTDSLISQMRKDFEGIIDVNTANGEQKERVADLSRHLDKDIYNIKKDSEDLLIWFFVLLGLEVGVVLILIQRLFYSKPKPD